MYANISTVLDEAYMDAVPKFWRDYLMDGVMSLCPRHGCWQHAHPLAYAQDVGINRQHVTFEGIEQHTTSHLLANPR